MQILGSKPKTYHLTKVSKSKCQKKKRKKRKEENKIMANAKKYDISKKVESNTVRYLAFNPEKKMLVERVSLYKDITEDYINNNPRIEVIKTLRKTDVDAVCVLSTSPVCEYYGMYIETYMSHAVQIAENEKRGKVTREVKRIPIEYKAMNENGEMYSDTLMVKNDGKAPKDNREALKIVRKIIESESDNTVIKAEMKAPICTMYGMPVNVFMKYAGLCDGKTRKPIEGVSILNETEVNVDDTEE